MSARRHLSSTTSLCPDCLQRVPGEYVTDEESVYLQRECKEHGETMRKVWDSVEHWEWASQFQPDAPFDPDGDFTVDNDHACLAVVEVTSDCNLSCSYCFASSGPGGTHKPFADIERLFQTIIDSGGPRPIQLSGGEPTVRDDLPELVERAGDMGFEHVQVNTNGIALVERDDYAERLAEAGVTAIYLQFDGLQSETYEQIREVDLTDTKRAAVEACREAGLSVVLVPTIVPGTNDHEMGDIVRYALENRDVVEAVNFQPVAHFGRYEKNDGRFSLDTAAKRLAEGFDGLNARDLMPVPCCSAYCQSATGLLPSDDGPIPVTRFLSDDLFTSVSGMVDESDWMELIAKTPAGDEAACKSASCCGGDKISLPAGADEMLDRVLPVSLTGFMDADAADAERLDNCCISVPTEDGDLVPFCGYNMTTDDGKYALRNRNNWGGRPGVNESMPADAQSDLTTEESTYQPDESTAGDD
jgi:Predicted Fe-S oxidoreductases